ncbi:MarR family winged helix-turn-helix transcriptional regulator [Streptomyces goshikiensis]|uniref:MarR family winged helix-turn-helix transcriptional regulator n=1 Tax=Streptomyces goshikiensis TaxID=1942 RepID=UPI00364C7B25
MSDDDVEGMFALAPKLAQLGSALNSGWLHERATQLSEVSLERPALQVLGVLQAAGKPRRIGEIAAEMRVEGPHVTRHVQRLEHRGLVERVVDPQDRRARLIGITPRGVELSTRYRTVVFGWLSQAFASWSDQDRKDLVRLGSRMVDDFIVFLEQERSRGPEAPPTATPAGSSEPTSRQGGVRRADRAGTA